MTQQDKDLLLKVLCDGIPYGVILHFDAKLNQDDEYFYGIRENGGRNLINDAFYIEEVKPYLRDMEDMTEEEKTEFQSLQNFYKYYNALGTHYKYYDTMESIDWLNKNHFNWRGLSKERYIKVTKENNPYEQTN